jgi:hypothetical protein
MAPRTVASLSSSVTCSICQKRRARRLCPSLSSEICAQCCGESREISIDCPSTCEYLRQARLHEQPPPVLADLVPNRDYVLTEDFLQQQQPLVLSLALAVKRAMETERAIDFDAREGMEALIKTYRTRESGLIYEPQPQNPYAAEIQQRVASSIDEIRKGIQTELGPEASADMARDSDVLGSLIFLQRLEYQHNNGRRRGRAFLDFLSRYFPEKASVKPAEGIES